MKTATTIKTLAMLGLTSLALVAGSSQADNGYPYWGGNANPWLANQAPQQGHLNQAMRARVEQLDQRQDNQLQRILQGMETGKLTMNEATGLLREHLAISTLERRYLADGRLGPNELSNLERRLEEANRHIMFEKHDREQQRGQAVRPDDRDPRGQPDGRDDWGRR